MTTSSASSASSLRPRRLVGVIGLGSLFASLLSACGYDSTSGCDPEPSTSTTEEEIPESEVLEATGEVGQGPIDDADACFELCDGNAISCKDVGEGTDTPTGEPTRRIECVVDTTTYCEGRRHAAVDADRTGRGPNEVAAWLARAAEAEAASVPAFVALRDELIALGAPSELADGARRAAADEVRHADVMGRLAAGRGAAGPSRHARVDPPARSLFELALENAVEGCVYETFSGLVAMHQARHAADPAVRETMTGIAEDEVRHGELAWRIHSWACGRLSDEEVAAIEAAVERAADAMIAQLGDERFEDATRAALGLPSPTTAAALARAARAELWS